MLDLGRADFELAEDQVPQKIEQFERVGSHLPDRSFERCVSATSISARLLDRTGTAVPIPLTTTVRDDADATRAVARALPFAWIVGDGVSCQCHEICIHKDGMKIRLTRKHAEAIDGVDLRGRTPGDVFELPPEQGRLLVAEQWAIPERREQQVRAGPRRREDDCPR